MQNTGDDIYGSPEHQAFRETVRKFVQTELAPRAREFDKLGPHRQVALPEDGRARPARHPLRPEVRRPGPRLLLPRRSSSRSWRSATTPASRWASACRPTWPRRPSHRFGSEELKRKYLVPAIRGEQVGGHRRHRAGRRLRRRRHQDARRARRRRLGDQRLEDLHHQRRHRRLALPPRGHRSRRPATAASARSSSRPTRPGFTYQLLDKIGNKGSDTGLLFFEDVRVPVTNTIGDAEPRLPAADDAVPGRAHGADRHGAR